MNWEWRSIRFLGDMMKGSRNGYGQRASCTCMKISRAKTWKEKEW